MEATPVNLDDYTCSICREIFQCPVSLSCPHTYCQSCVIGLRKSSSSESQAAAVAASSSLRPEAFSHSSHVHQASQCFVCAICRQESLGFVRYRELENRLQTLTTPCSSCNENYTLAELRVHSESCSPSKPSSRPAKLEKHLSTSQAQALQKAMEGENRSTFACPFCERTNFTGQHLRQHVKKRHLNESQARVCPICASMPWGDKSMLVINLYRHLKSRHQFDYDTYVNYEQDEDAMMREALRASMLDH